MTKGSKGLKIGVWAFTIGVILAILAGFIPGDWNLNGLIVATLVVLGIVVGFLNVTSDETTGFLMASVAVMIALFTAGSALESSMETLGPIGTYMWSMMKYINIFVFPATIVVSIKAIYALAKD